MKQTHLFRGPGLADRLDTLWRILHDGHIVRRIAFFFVLYLTWDCYHWAMELVTLHGMTLEVAANVGAVLAPLSGLQAAVFTFYNAGRKEANDYDRES